MARSLLCILLASGVLAASSTQPQTYSVRLYIEGGNVLVVRRDLTEAVIGAVLPVVNDDPEFNDHRMDLVLFDAPRDQDSQHLAPTFKKAGIDHYRLHGYTVRMCPGGDCTPSLPLAADLTPPETCKDTGDALGFVPNLTELHAGSELIPNWRDKLESAFVVTRGALRSSKVEGCFQFRAVSGSTVKRRPITHGTLGIVSEFTTNATYVDLRFEKEGQAAQIVRLRPRQGAGIDLRIQATEHPPDKTAMNDKQALTRFLPFYQLVRLATGDHPLGLYLDAGSSLQSVNPGGECPPGMIVW